MGIETPVATIQEPPRPALCENPAEFQTIAIPVVMRAKSIRIVPIDDEGKVDAEPNVANLNDNAKPSTKVGPTAVPVRDAYSASAKGFTEKPRRTLSTLRNITGIIYSLLSWTLLILSIWAIGN